MFFSLRQHGRSRKAISFHAALVVLISSHSWAQEIQLDNLGGQGFTVTGGLLTDFVGTSLAASGVGDVNGDGLGDIAVGPGGLAVIFAKSGNAEVSLSELGTHGIKLISDTTVTYSGNHVFLSVVGRDVSGAGDFDGDGLDDVILGGNTGQAHILFGTTRTFQVDLNSSTDESLPIFSSGGSSVGRFVSGAGDFNGDGFSDVIVSGVGQVAYLIAGRRSRLPIDLDALADGGFPITVGAEGRVNSVSGIGDANGDGLDDVTVSKSNASNQIVVFGKTDVAPVDTATLGNQGTFVLSQKTFGAGDVNGDGVSDLLLWRGVDEPVYVLFGGDVTLGQPSANGFSILPSALTRFSTASGAGDVNGDGFGDVLLSASEDRDGIHTTAYLVYGKSDGTAVDVGALGDKGLRLVTQATYYAYGKSVSGGGDANGDGIADFLVSWQTESGGVTSVVFGERESYRVAYHGYVRNLNAPWRAIGVSGDGSKASHPDSRAWIQFLDGAHPTRPAAAVSVELIGDAGTYADSISPVSWHVSTDRAGWSSADVMFRYLDAELPENTNEHALQLVFSPDGGPPFQPLPSRISPDTNTISATTEGTGYFYIRSVEVFSSSFE